MVVTENNYPKLTEVFEDVATHIAVAQIIHDHSSNKQDVRSVALEGLPLHLCRNMLDVGCGFGFFTLALKGRIKKGSAILGIDRFTNYRKPYLDNCKRAGLEGHFDGSGIKALFSLPSDAFDLVLCSYGLYFFPEIIPEIARILKPSGTFVIITHSDDHMQELITFIKTIYATLNLSVPGLLPCEELISVFDNRNGMSLLARKFNRTEEKQYHSSLIFDPGHFDDLKTYLRFKRPFFIPDKHETGNRVFNEVIRRLHERMILEKVCHIKKNDTIFICRKPLIHL